MDGRLMAMNIYPSLLMVKEKKEKRFIFIQKVTWKKCERKRKCYKPVNPIALRLSPFNIIIILELVT